MGPGKKGGRWRRARGGRDRRWRCEGRRGGCRGDWRRCLFRRRGNPGTPTGHSSPPCAAAMREMRIHAPRKRGKRCDLGGGLWPPLENAARGEAQHNNVTVEVVMLCYYNALCAIDPS